MPRSMTTRAAHAALNYPRDRHRGLGIPHGAKIAAAHGIVDGDGELRVRPDAGLLKPAFRRFDPVTEGDQRRVPGHGSGQRLVQRDERTRRGQVMVFGGGSRLR